MGRRFRRPRWLAQQVVTVIRRLWRVCQCCGTVTAYPRQDVVPLAAILSNTKAARLKPGRSKRSIGVCCNCLVCTCFKESRHGYHTEDLSVDLRESKTSVATGGGTQVEHVADRTPRASDISKDIVCGENWLQEFTATDVICQELRVEKQFLESSCRQTFEFAPKRIHVLGLNRADSSNCLNCHPPGDDDTQTASIRSSSSNSSCGSHQTDDNVALRYYPSSPVQPTSIQYGNIQPTSSQTDDIVAIRYSYPRPSHIHHISSQTDDMVALRFYSRLPQLQTTSSQTDDMVCRRFYPMPSQIQPISAQTVNIMNNISPQRSSQTDDIVPMRYYPRSTCVQRVSSQTDDIVAMRFHAEVSRIFNRPGEVDQAVPVRCNSVPSKLFPVSSQTDDDVAMRYLSGPVRLLAMSSQTDDHVAMRFYNDAYRLPRIDDPIFRTAPTELYRQSSQTDDIVAMRFLTEPPHIVNQSSQTDDRVAMRFYDDPTPPISTSSDDVTDDGVVMRYYPQQLRWSSRSRQTDDSVSMRYCSAQNGNSPDLQQPVRSTDLDISGPSQSYQRDAGQHPWRTRGNPVPDTEDSSTSIEVKRRHWNVKESKLSADDPGSAQVRTQLTLKFPLSDLPVPPVHKPEDLRVEFAIVDEWHRIYPVEWTKIQNIARTRTGRVDLTILGEYNRQIALKTLDAEASGMEAELLVECQGPFVVQLCACMVQGSERFLCMTYYNRRDLSKWLGKDLQRKHLKETEGIWIMAYIMAGVNFLHKKKIIHVDIKPANILIDNKGYPVIGDFGSAMRMTDLADFVAYTPAYAAPEIHDGEKPDRQSDLWSVACIYYEILMKRVPYVGKFSMETELRVSLGVALEASSMSAQSRDFLCCELKLQKEDRLGFKGTARRVMRHAVFKSIHWSEVKHRSRKLECRLFEVFRHMERDEFNRRNKPDPIPPDSIFYRPWSFYMKQQQQSPKAVESAGNECQNPGPSGLEGDANAYPNTPTESEEKTEYHQSCPERDEATTKARATGGFSGTDIDSQQSYTGVQISCPSRARNPCTMPDRSEDGAKFREAWPETEPVTAAEEATHRGYSGTDVDYKPSTVLFHRPRPLDVCDARTNPEVRTELKEADTSSQNSERYKPAEGRGLNECGQLTEGGPAVPDVDFNDSVDQT